MSEAQATRTPRHLWVVGIVVLLWNLLGAWDYIMTETKNEAYMGQFTPEQLEFFYGFPAWLVAVRSPTTTSERPPHRAAATGQRQRRPPRILPPKNGPTTP